MAKLSDPLLSQPPPARSKVRGLGFRDRSLLAARSRVRPWAGVAVSLFAHVAVFGGALAYAHYTPPRLVPEKPMVAKLVRLGKPRDEKLLPRLPAPAPVPVVAKPPPPVPAPPAPAPPPAPVVAPVPVVPVSPTTPAPRDAAKAALEELERRNRMMQALGAVPTGPKPEELEGQADGDRLGEEAEAAAGDMYLGLVVQALKRNYVVPTTIPRKERLFLSCKLRLFIEPDGTISRSTIEVGSGNAQFDRAVEASIQRTRLLKPPAAFLAQFGADGVGFEFKP